MRPKTLRAAGRSPSGPERARRASPLDLRRRPFSKGLTPARALRRRWPGACSIRSSAPKRTAPGWASPLPRGLLPNMVASSSTRPKLDRARPLGSPCHVRPRANMNPKLRVLVIEDDPGVAGSLKKELEAEGYDAAVAFRGDDGLIAAKQSSFDVVITDLKLPGLSGLDLVDQLRAAKPNLPIILMTAYGTTKTAIEATRLGAFEYVLKPFEMTELLALVAKAVACDRPTSGLLELGAADSNQPGIVGHSRAMQTLYKEIGQAGQAAMNVLIRD